jgi:DNA-binding MarR family transcriptional regulator
MKKDELAKEVVESLIKLRKSKIHDMTGCFDLTHNENLVLFIIHDMAIDGKVSLSILRDKIKLAPSTVTPIINSLEKKELIVRNIDREDRRNIYLNLSEKGTEYTKKAYDSLVKRVSNFINYMGEDDANELVRLVSKATEYIKEKEKNK